MLRPSAFNQNNGSNEATSSSKSIIRPSSFQLAPSSLSSISSTNKNDCDEAATSSSNVATSSDATNEQQENNPIATTSDAHKEDDSANISSTTNNDEANAENTSEPKTASNPFNNSKIRNADLDDDTEAIPATKSDASEEKPKEPELEGTNLFASTNTKNLFAAATSKSSSLLSNGSSNNFVFGQNIHERIVGAPDTSVSSNVDDSNSDSSDTSKLFAVNSSAHASTAAASSSSDATPTNGAEPKESSTVEDLTKVAREYEESRAQKRKLEAVETFTGEENEVNVLDFSCKLFAFIASNWEQRGPGCLRLNDVKSHTDESDTRSRVVFRTQGNYRVLLNTKVWSGMVVEKPSQKSLRLTAIDPNDGLVKIFLVMARPDDLDSLNAALKKRIATEKLNDEPEAKKEKKLDPSD